VRGQLDVFRLEVADRVAAEEGVGGSVAMGVEGMGDVGVDAAGFGGWAGEGEGRMWRGSRVATPRWKSRNAESLEAGSCVQSTMRARSWSWYRRRA